jgi:glycosyltransferase involved in cell wall biosynthesis
MWWLVHSQFAAISKLHPDVFISLGGVGLGKGSAAKVMFIQQSLPFCREALRRCDLRTRIRIRTIGTLMKASCNSADLVITQTPTMAKWICNGYGISPERVAVVMPWVDRIGLAEEQDGAVSPMYGTPPDRRILYVGNTNPYKNLACLADALPEVRRHIPGATLFVTCPADSALCKSEGIVGLGNLGGNTLRDAYRLATVFVTPSLVESGNLCLVEAMTLGVPILAADRPYARDLCGDAAVYFDPDQPAALANAIVGLLQNSGERDALVRKARETAERGHDKRPFDQMMDMLLALAQKKASISNGNK